MGRKYNDLIGGILASTGEKDNFKGKGKPLPKRYVEQDLFQNFQEKAKDAGFLPPWLKLQKEISTLVEIAETEEDIKKVNKKVRKYNLNCPPPMQKLPVRLKDLEQTKKVWRS
ncbi:MAG TPA: DnaJ family domain-containing protein [Bacillota bacterium]|nr:DnaJ family domain-containing protein [Bacillota bacterium]